MFERNEIAPHLKSCLWVELRGKKPRDGTLPGVLDSHNISFSGYTEYVLLILFIISIIISLA